MKHVFLTPHADRQALEIETWWLANRDKAPLLFVEELAKAIAVIGRAPNAGKLWRDAREAGVRRVLPRRSKYHVYYVEAPNEIWVVAVWGAPRGTGPELGTEPF